MLKNKNYIVTFGTEFLIMFLSFMVFRLAYTNLEEVGFSEYTLIRRSISFLQPLLMIGLGVAIPRYVSLEPGRSSLLPSGLIWMFLSILVICLSLWFGRFYTSYLFFGSENYHRYILPIAMLLSLYGLHAVIYGFLRGMFKVFQANFVQLINVGIIPTVSVYFTNNVNDLLLWNISLLTGSLVLFISYHMIRMKIRFTKEQFIADSKLLLVYGLPRVLGDFALLGLLTLPTFLILNLEKNILLGGDVAYSLTLLNLAGAAFGPLGLILLPEIVSAMRVGNLIFIRRRFFVFTLICLGLTFVGVSVFYLFSDTILGILLGEEYRSSIIPTSKIILLSAFGYCLYIVLRSFLDALKVKASNSINLLICLAVYGILIGIGKYWNLDFNFYLFSFVGIMTLLGLLTFIESYQSIKKL
jgi:O-antigen/teichoic acid export membrane protein